MKRMMEIILFVIFLTLLTGCATPYKQLGLGGGYSDFALANDTYKVSFRGNGYASEDLVQNYLLRRCAELTLQNGYKYFVLIAGNTSTKQSAWTTPAQIQSNSYGNFYGIGNSYENNMHGNYDQNTLTTISPSQVAVVNRYTSEAIIKMLNTNKDYPSALNAMLILSNFSSNK